MYCIQVEDQIIETLPLKGKKHVSEAHFVKKKDKFCENDQAKTASKFLCPYYKSKFSQKFNLKMHIKKVYEGNIKKMICQKNQICLKI